ncbi:MAG TPA: TetR/AcrR family transcriptional regulator [Acidimicrobiales bacterium]
MVVKGKKQERGEATREALTEAARRLFGQQGFNATSLDEIVNEAGVTKGALYHHFSDKEELFMAVAESVRRDTTVKLQDLFLLPDPFAALEAGCMAIFDAYLDPAVRQIVLTDARSVLSAAAYRELQSRDESAFVRATLRRAMREGVIETQPLRPLAIMLTGAIGEACTLIAGAEDPTAAREEVGQVLTRLLAGLRPPASPRNARKLSAARGQ